MRRSHSILATSTLLSLALFNACGGNTDDSFGSTGGVSQGGFSSAGQGGGIASGGLDRSTGGFGSPSTGGVVSSGGFPTAGSGTDDAGAGPGGAGGVGPHSTGGMKASTGGVGGNTAPGGGGGGKPNGGMPGKGAQPGGAAGEDGGVGGVGGAACPGEVPESKSSCSEAIDCDYAEVTCKCAGPMDKAAWDCKPLPPTCPDAPPEAGTACERSMPPLDCRYEMADQRCACKDGKWDCAAAACPPMPPQEEMPCEAKRACTYGEQSCACEKGGWHCTPPTPKP